MKYTKIKTTLCDMVLVGDNLGLSILHLENIENTQNIEIDPTWEYDNDFFNDVTKDINDYLLGQLSEFTIKLNPIGTAFQKKVWQELNKIPYSETRTYKDIAIAIGNKNASRAVGAANGKNPIPIITPCHRVIGSNGKLVGFAFGLDIKLKLLDIEK